MDLDRILARPLAPIFPSVGFTFIFYETILREAGFPFGLGSNQNPRARNENESD